MFIIGHALLSCELPIIHIIRNLQINKYEIYICDK